MHNNTQYTQNDAPLMQAMEKYLSDRIVRFDVPGHKGGRGTPELTKFIGEKAMKLDVNSMKPLDNLCHPVSVIRDAQNLAAEAFGAENAFFIVNGATGGVQAMIMSTCKRGDKLIMPRNVHRSAINALVVNGAVPVYVNPDTNNEIGIPLGMSPDAVEKAIKENPDAKAVLVNNPTYYGVCTDLKKIVETAHAHGMKVLVDEAHGTHFYFGENMPITAMAAGADMASVSVHKTGGSLTQSAILLMGKNINYNYVRQILNLTQTTSANYLLMVSLDIARRNLALNGREIYRGVCDFCSYARSEINSIGGFYAYGDEIINNTSCFAFDPTKLSVNTRKTGLAGIEVYDILRDRYDIQIEFGDLGNILAIIAPGDRALEIERLISAMFEIKRLNSRKPSGDMPSNEYIEPLVAMSPQEAFYAEKESVPVEKAEGRVSGEFVMCYPPGIPILAPGEVVTDEVIKHIVYSKEKGCSLTGTEDLKVDKIKVL